MSSQASKANRNILKYTYKKYLWYCLKPCNGILVDTYFENSMGEGFPPPIPPLDPRLDWDLFCSENVLFLPAAAEIVLDLSVIRTDFKKSC